MFTTLNNTQLYNTTLPLINNELLNSNDSTINQPIISSSNLNNHHHHNIQTSNLSNELLNELFNSINPISNIQLNLTKLTNLYINEYYKHINQQLLINNNNENFNQSIFNNYLNDTLKQQNFIHNNELQLNNLNINSLPITDFSIKSYQSLFIDTNEPLDLKDNESTNQHQGVEEFQLLNQKTDESIPSSSPYFINNYPLSCFSPSCEEFHYRLAYFLIRDFHPPRILEEEGFKILIGILWNKFQRINNDINYNIQFNFLPSSKLMENQILNNLYNQLKFNIDNKIKKLMILQQSIENQLLILPQITISLKYWSLNSVNKNQFNNDNLFFEYVDIELNFFINSQYIPKCNHIFYGTYERALCVPKINEVLTNYQKSLQTLDENVQQVEDLSSESNLKSRSNDQTSINESLSDILDSITRIIPNMDRLPHFTDVDMNLINRIFKSIEIVQEIEKLCKTNYSHFTVSMILPILKNLYSINIEKINDNLSNQFYTTIITYLKTIFNENNILEEFLYISTFLDPRFKNSMNQNDYEHILHRLQIKISLLDDYVEKMGLHRKMSYMDEFQYSINDYLNEKSININENPIQWWNDQCDKSEKYYIFKILALYYLTIPLNILNNNNNNTNIDDTNSPPSDISSPSSDISSNYTQQQNINKLIEQFENCFQNENNSIQINMSKIINVDNNILQDDHISTVISTDYSDYAHL
ncbi:unnamed protein product [Schistosoma mattheei]|uniref:Uncharacterized protein n=1 Tax=Schistosoma mattheei TaxID=31246 RepID=A0A183NV55_9TREM|nr:unnamed protein product [Schistosoma mattheei]